MIEKIPELSWGAFVPQFLGYFNYAEGKELKWFTDLDRGAFFHEAVHYINALSSNYSIHIILECLDVLKMMVTELGGNASGIFSFSIVQSGAKYWEHFSQQSQSYEGRYAYNNLNIKEYMESVGCFKEDAAKMLFDLESLKESYITIFNKNTRCHEVLCWNHVSKQYFVIPIGIMAMQECQAYINEMIHASDSDEFAMFSLNSTKYPSESPMHVYTIIFELFNKAIIESDEIEGSKEQKLLFLEFALDISMQMPLFVEDENYIDSYVPSAIFIKILDYVQQKKCVPDLSTKDAYIKYLDEISNAIEFYSCTKSWGNLNEAINFVLNCTNNDLSRYISSEFMINYSSKIADLVIDATKENLANNHFRNDLNDMGTKQTIIKATYKYIHNNKSVLVNGNLGGGLLHFLRTVLQMRIDNPHYFTYPHKYFHKYFDDILPPIVFFNNKPVSYFTTDKYWLLRDIQFIKHLWAIYLQREEFGETVYKCGNRFFGIECKNQCKNSCYNYDHKNRSFKIVCEYTDCLTWFKLIYRITNEEAY